MRAKGCGSIVSAYTTQAITVGPGTPAAFTAALTCVAPASTGIVYTIPVLIGAISYDCVTPNGWTFTGNGSRSITITSSITSGGTVRVRGIGCNGTTGPYRDVVVTVAPAQPGAIAYYVGSPGNTCIGQGSNVAVSLSVPAVSGATRYTWTIPSGWTATTLTTTTPTNTVLTDAASGGVITVAASASGCTGNAQSVTLQRSGIDFCISENSCIRHLPRLCNKRSSRKHSVTITTAGIYPEALSCLMEMHILKPL